MSPKLTRAALKQESGRDTQHCEALCSSRQYLHVICARTQTEQSVMPFNLIISGIWPRPQCPTPTMELAAETGERGELEVDTCGLESQCGSNQDTVGLNTEPLALMEPIQLRIKQLLNRRLFLLEMLCFWKTTHGDGSRASGECESPRLLWGFSFKSKRLSAFKDVMLTFQLWKRKILLHGNIHFNEMTTFCLRWF